jgi:hypothetical protein
MAWSDFTYTVNYARDYNDFTFTFAPSTDFPSTIDGGKIFLDFPSNFILKNPNNTVGWSYPC